MGATTVVSIISVVVEIRIPRCNWEIARLTTMIQKKRVFVVWWGSEDCLSHPLGIQEESIFPLKDTKIHESLFKPKGSCMWSSLYEPGFSAFSGLSTQL